MDCERCLEQLSARLDGELSAGEKAELEAHLARCSDCRALARELEALHGGFSGLEELETPAGFAQEVMDRIQKERLAPKVIPLFRRPQFRALAGLAACAALCVGLYGAGQLGDTAFDRGEAASDTAVSFYSAAPEDAGGSGGTAPAQYDTYDVAPRVNASLAEPEDTPAARSEAPTNGAQTDAFDGEGEPPQSSPSQETFSQVLTLDALPQGAAELLSPDTVVSHSTADDSDTYSPLTPEQLDAIQTLAQAQGITGDRASFEGQDGPCALVILGS